MNALLYLSVVVIWGTTWLAIAMQQGVVAVPVSVFYRFLIAGGVMMTLLLLTGRLRRLTPRDHLFCLLQGGCVFGLNFLCFYQAAAYISTGLESVIFSMAVLFNALNGMVFFRQKPGANLLPAGILGMTGIVALFWHDLTAARISPELLTGIGLSALGTYCFSLGNMISARHQKRGLDVLSTNAYAMCYGAVLMGGVALWRQETFTLIGSAQYVGSLLYLAIFGSVIAFTAYFSLVGRIGAGQAAYSTLLFPLVALALSTVYEGYEWRINAVIGLMLILTGNLVMFARPGEMKKAGLKRILGR